MRNRPMLVKTLFIDPWVSQCGDCGRSVNPHSMTCDPFNGTPPCDDREYEALSSHYMGMEDAVQPMRPDLRWVDVFEAVGQWTMAQNSDIL